MTLGYFETMARVALGCLDAAQPALSRRPLAEPANIDVFAEADFAPPNAIAPRLPPAGMAKTSSAAGQKALAVAAPAASAALPPGMPAASLLPGPRSPAPFSSDVPGRNQSLPDTASLALTPREAPAAVAAAILSASPPQRSPAAHTPRADGLVLASNRAAMTAVAAPQAPITPPSTPPTTHLGTARPDRPAASATADLARFSPPAPATAFGVAVVQRHIAVTADLSLQSPAAGGLRLMESGGGAAGAPSPSALPNAPEQRTIGRQSPDTASLHKAAGGEPVVAPAPAPVSAVTTASVMDAIQGVGARTPLSSDGLIRQRFVATPDVDRSPGESIAGGSGWISASARASGTAAAVNSGAATAYAAQPDSIAAGLPALTFHAPAVAWGEAISAADGLTRDLGAPPAHKGSALQRPQARTTADWATADWATAPPVSSPGDTDPGVAKGAAATAQHSDRQARTASQVAQSLAGSPSTAVTLFSAGPLQPVPARPTETDVAQRHADQRDAHHREPPVSIAATALMPIIAGAAGLISPLAAVQAGVVQLGAAGGGERSQSVATATQPAMPVATQRRAPGTRPAAPAAGPPLPAAAADRDKPMAGDEQRAAVSGAGETAWDGKVLRPAPRRQMIAGDSVDVAAEPPPPVWNATAVAADHRGESATITRGPTAAVAGPVAVQIAAAVGGGSGDHRAVPAPGFAAARTDIGQRTLTLPHAGDSVPAPIAGVPPLSAPAPAVPRAVRATTRVVSPVQPAARPMPAPPRAGDPLRPHAGSLLPEPVVRINIGRIRIAGGAPAPPGPRFARPAPALGLARYTQMRRDGRR